jgi:hypothetical protein
VAALAAIFVVGFATAIGFIALTDGSSPNYADEISALKAAPGSEQDAAHKSKSEEHGEAAEDAEPVSLYPREVILPFLVWSIVPVEGSRVRILYQTISHVDDRNVHTMLCRNEPRILEVLNLVFNLMHPKKRAATIEELEQAAVEILKRMESLFDGFMPSQMTLITKADPRFDHNPPTCRPPPPAKQKEEG